MLGQPHSTLPRAVLDLQTPGERTLTLSYAGFTEFHIAYLKLHLECLVVRFLYFLSMVSFLGMRLKRKLFQDLSMFCYNECHITTYFCEKLRFNFDPNLNFITSFHMHYSCAGIRICLVVTGAVSYCMRLILVFSRNTHC